MEGLKHFILGCMFLWRVHPQVFLHQLQLCQCSQVHHHLLVQEVHQLRQHIPHRPHTRLPTHPTLLLLLWVPAQARRYSGMLYNYIYWVELSIKARTALAEVGFVCWSKSLHQIMQSWYGGWGSCFLLKPKAEGDDTNINVLGYNKRNKK